MSPSFDLIVAAFKKNNLGLTFFGTETPISMPKGEEGERTWSFELHDIEPDFSEAADFAGLLREELGLSCQVKMEFIEEGATVNDFSFLLVSEDPSDRWAVHVDGSKPRDQDFSTTATIAVIEGDENIRAIFLDEEKKTLETAANRTIDVVHDYTQGSSERAVALFEQLSRQNPEFLKLWRAHLENQALENTTPQAKSSRPSSRM